MNGQNSKQPQLPSDGAEALLEAASQGNLDEIQQVLDLGVSPQVADAKGWTPLHLAAVYNHAHLIEPLIAAGAYLEAKTNEDLSKYALWSLATPLHCTIERDALEAARELIHLGADVNARDAFGQTPLRFAVETSGTYCLVAPEIARLFIEAGADVNSYDNAGYTVFHQASNAIDLSPDHKESQEVIEMLQERKAWMW